MHDLQRLKQLSARLTEMGSPVSLLPPGQAAPGDALLRALDPEGWRLCVPSEEPGAAAMLALAAAMLAEEKPRPTALSRRERLWRFLTSATEEDTRWSAAELGLTEKAPRCVLYLKGADAQSGALLAGEAPVQAGEALLPCGEDSAILVKNLAHSDEDEVTEYAQALMETMTQEAGLLLTVGIGGRCEALSELPRSFREAETSVRLGLAFHGPGGVHRYDRLLLERFLSQVPEDTRARCSGMLFNQQTERVMNDEMLETVRHFLENDLNVADTARQLYIHRNTLLYRLDKLQKATGLDLRRFDDAMTFRLLMLCRSASEKELS